MDVAEAKTLELPDRRCIAYAEYGRPDGHPVLFFHGSPSTRIEAALFAAAAERAGIRLVAADRPGIGRSDYRPRWRYRNLVDDVRGLAAHLGLERFGVLGWSGGGPPALALAHGMPDRLNAVVLVAAAPFGALERRVVRREIGPITRLGAKCAWALPSAMDWLVWPLGRFARWRPEHFMETFAIKLCPADQEVLNDPEQGAIIESNLQEAFRQGVRGYAHDLDRLFSKWGFDLGEIDLPITIWQGEDDGLVLLELERALAERLPRATLRSFPGEGHYLLVPRADELFAIFREAAEERAA